MKTQMSSLKLICDFLSIAKITECTLTCIGNIENSVNP